MLTFKHVVLLEVTTVMLHHTCSPSKEIKYLHLANLVKKKQTNKKIKHILSCLVWLWLLPLGVFIYLEWEKVLPEQTHAKTWALSSNPSESPCMYRAEIQIFLVLSNNNKNKKNDKMLVLYRVEVMWCTRRRRIQRKARMRVRQPGSVLQWADRFAVLQGFNHISTQRLGNNRNLNKSCSRKRHQQCVH